MASAVAVIRSNRRRNARILGISLFTIKQEEMGKLSGPVERETDQL